MSMKTTLFSNLPVPPQLTGDNDKDIKLLLEHQTRMAAVIKDINEKVYMDLALGAAHLQERTAAPTTSDIDQGEMTIVTSAASTYLFTRMSNTIKYTGLT